MTSNLFNLGMVGKERLVPHSGILFAGRLDLPTGPGPLAEGFYYGAGSYWERFEDICSGDGPGHAMPKINLHISEGANWNGDFSWLFFRDPPVMNIGIRNPSQTWHVL